MKNVNDKIKNRVWDQVGQHIGKYVDRSIGSKGYGDINIRVIREINPILNQTFNQVRDNIR